MPEQRLGKRGQSMAYKLNVTEHADELLDRLIYHLIYRLKNEQAARHLLDSMEVIYDSLEVNGTERFLVKAEDVDALVKQIKKAF